MVTMIAQIRGIAEKYLEPYSIGEDTGYRHREGKCLSISEFEGRFMYDLIKKHHLEIGYELATGTGYSSLWLSLALEFLFTLDNYSEDGSSIALESTKKMQEELYGSCFIRLGNGDSSTCVDAFVAGFTFDCVFIDGDHTGKHPTLDYEAIKDYLDEKCIIFWHDHSQEPVRIAIDLAIKRDGFESMEGHQRLAVISRGL